jgi:hypothetical protein
MFEKSADDENGPIGKSVGFVSVTPHVEPPLCPNFCFPFKKYDASLCIFDVW